MKEAGSSSVSEESSELGVIGMIGVGVGVIVKVARSGSGGAILDESEMTVNLPKNEPSLIESAIIC